MEGRKGYIKEWSLREAMKEGRQGRLERWKQEERNGWFIYKGRA
jgi:hypothetical protein